MAIKKMQIGDVRIHEGFFIIETGIVREDGTVISGAFRFPIQGDKDLDALCGQIGDVLEQKLAAALGVVEFNKSNIEVVS